MKQTAQIELDKLIKQDWDLNQPVLSLYLNIDQGWERNLNRGYLVPMRNKLRDAGEKLPGHVAPTWYESAAAHASSIVERQTPKGRTLVVFTDPARSYEWTDTLAVRCEDSVNVGPRPAIAPLVLAQDEYEPCLVVLTDRAHARLFVLEMGNADKPLETVSELDVDRPAAAGSDQLLSQSRFQRRADEHARIHLQNVAEIMETIADERECRKLVVGGPEDAVNELTGLLNESLRERLVITVTIAVDASPPDIASKIRNVVTDCERRDERVLVDELLQEVEANGLGTLGLPDCSAAANAGRVRQLVVADCEAEEPQEMVAAARHAFQQEVRPWLETREDICELLMQQALLTGGEIETIRGEPAMLLNDRGNGVGAFLRY